MSFADLVHDLGGDENDIELLKDVDTDNSDYEKETGPADAGLVDDVASMWQELQGKPKKIVFEESKKDENKEKERFLAEQEAKAAKREKQREKKEKKDKKDKKEKPAKKEQLKQEVEAPASVKPTKLSAKIQSISHPLKQVISETDIWAHTPAKGTPAPADQVANLKIKAIGLLNTEVEVFQKSKKSDSEYKTQLEFLRSGTFSDQLGTLSLLITESPLHNLKGMESLLSKCDVKSRESAVKALEVLKDLLVSHVLPDRRLKHFKDQPLTTNASVESLIIWAYEDWLKDYYFKLLGCIERLVSDSVEHIRIRTLVCIFGLFESKPEQELNLLRLSTNKLGDMSGKVASQVKKLLLDTFNVHPGIKPIAASIINEGMERSKEYRFRYYAVDTLSEFILSSNDPKLANQLLYIYLNLFERLLAEWDAKGDAQVEAKAPAAKKGRKPKRGKKGGLVQKQKTSNQLEEEQNARLVAKIFTGLNRAFPFSKVEASAFTKYMNTLYKMGRSPNTSTFIEALSFIFQLAQAQQGQGLDRYYSALYESLLDKKLYQSSKLSKYLHLLLKSVAKDTFAPRSMAFSKRILQTAIQWPEIGAVASLAHIVNYIPGSMDLVHSPENPLDEHYDIMARDPKFVKAETSKLWEVLPLLNHYHPTVTLYADNLVSDEKKSLDMPDIEQHTVSSFLTKWSYKKPKEKELTRGGSMFQPLSGFTDLTLGIRREEKSRQEIVSLRDWSSRKPEDIRPDERFFFEYFKDRPKKTKPKKEAKKVANEDDSDLEEADIFNAISKSNPDEMPSDSEGELGFDSDEDLDELAKEMGSDSSDNDDIDGDSDLEDGEDLSEGDIELGSDFGSDSGDEGLSDDEEGETGEEPSDFSEFSNSESEEAEEEPKPKVSTKSAKKGGKRKRGEWQDMPTFMDADQFEEFSKKPKA